ncbi:hypothetical protein M2302_003002 [Micromonospora sp. A200]|uniref:hypothetical protein n=1 Tax=Micromonospora sp. A200 TaxID=2940568 RepID=UPI00247495EA|nr:hypothetical protein [Micromonospora sp. A200]MDH6462821.1 hypothetical protein [Micromonospora sp. A200]
MRDSDSLIFDLVATGTPGRLSMVRVFSVAWRVETGQEILVGADDEPADLPGMVKVLNGCALVDVSVSWPSLDTTFDFGDLRLRIFPVTSRVDRRYWQQWSVRLADGRILDVGPGQSWQLTGQASARGHQ